MQETTQHISLDLVDDPKIAMRSDVDADDIDELKASMAKDGLLQPIVVRKTHNEKNCPPGTPVLHDIKHSALPCVRYEVIAGHRRTRAARLLNWAMIEAKVIDADDSRILGLRLTENLQRHDVDPVDEACFIAESMREYKIEAPQIAEMLGRSLQWVTDRLEVFAMPEYLQTPLKHKRISLGAALWLGRIEHEATRRQYTTWAATNGVSVAGAKQWYENLKATNFILPATDVPIRDEGGNIQQVRKSVVCAACKGDVFLDEADTVWVHRVCPLS